MLYRGSQDGWMGKDMHSRCDGKKATLSLLKMDNGSCIGGFTKSQWSQPYTFTLKSDKDAIVFNLTLQKLFKVKPKSNAIFCQYGYGPSFGGGLWGELVIEEPFNEKNKCKSCINSNSYDIKIDVEGRNTLTNEACIKYLTHNVSFVTISELEVWEVTEAET